MEEQHNLAKWLANEMDANELQAFQNTPGFHTYTKIASYASALETPDFPEAGIYQNIMSVEKRQPKAVPFYQSQFFRIAAMLVLAIGIGYYFTNSQVTSQIAVNGQKTVFSLPDESQVTLNSGSEITYKKWNWDNRRSLELQGEAYFKVAKGKTFDVHTGLGKITVVGTQFNVKAREKRLEVECFEGKVRVAFNSQTIVLTKGQIVASENGIIIPAQPAVADSPYWMNREMRFESAALDAIIAEIERTYGIRIEQKNVPFKQNFTGILPSDDLEKALRILSKPFHLNFAIAKNKVTLSVNE